MKGLIVKKNANQFIALSDGQKYVCVPRGKTKVSGIFVGDYVEISNGSDVYSIENIYPRKNCLVRPPVANIDQMIILLSCSPKPDFLLIDKLILMCFLNKIVPVLCINKIDISSNDFIDEVKSQYDKVLKIVCISAKTNSNLDEIKSLFKGKVTTLAGQSAVGKSMLTNAILGGSIAEVGELSTRIDRGKNTTRLTEIFEIEPSSYLIDTAGFSFLDEDLVIMDPYDLWRYYPEFISESENCKYPNCSHTNEDESVCGVARAAISGKISYDRYIRYQVLFEIFKLRWKTNYGK